MSNNIPQKINSFLSGLKRTYDQQGQLGKLLFPGLFLLSFCCGSLALFSLLRSRGAANVVPSPVVSPSQGVGATPTSLFNFGPVTFTPFPTLPPPTAFPTFTPASTGSPTLTQIVPTATITLFPSSTNPPATATNSGSVTIIAVDKPAEYVDIQNLSSATVDLNGWTLVSEMGNQACKLRGVLLPNEIIRVWARRGSPGLSCRYPINIWNDNTLDPAVLYDPQGKEVSRYP